jgi:hypothetical protein
MQTVTTRHGKQITIISATDLRDPRGSGSYARAYCHIHGGDHQRSLSISRVTGWGRCFNATCQATVLVAEWNPGAAEKLIHFSGSDSPILPHSNAASASFVPHPSQTPSDISPFQQMLLLPPQPEIPRWQQDELATLSLLERHLRHSLHTIEGARRYLNARQIPLGLARATGVSYLPGALCARLHGQKRHQMARWSERIIFPLVSPAGRGYIGRTLHGWQPGMDENQHKALLDANEGQRRWIKTNPAGWFCMEFEELADCIILVEGSFDRLALLQAGFRAQDVVALGGTSAHIDWLPLYAPQVRGVVLALDADQGGHEAARKLAAQCHAVGLAVHICEPISDRQGKDWNERWRKMGRRCLFPLFKAYRAVRGQARSARPAWSA